MKKKQVLTETVPIGLYLTFDTAYEINRRLGELLNGKRFSVKEWLFGKPETTVVAKDTKLDSFGLVQHVWGMLIVKREGVEDYYLVFSNDRERDAPFFEFTQNSLSVKYYYYDGWRCREYTVIS